DRFSIDVKGTQTHGAMPWLGIDPIVTSAQIIMGLQTVPSRQVDVTKSPAVVTVGAINGGNRENIIPDSVRMIGTIRTFNEEVQNKTHEGVKRV
ncbi:peptidase dimerization domain-containing protein, partial [Acinetobacter baumannii]